LLRDADAVGPKKTPIGDVLAAAKVTIVDDETIDVGLLQRLLAKARSSTAALKSALGKILGLFEPQERLVVIDKELPAARRPFILLHEAGHGMPHQAKMYSLMQDCEQLLNPDVMDLFEREANVFASEVLFQGEQFAREAYDESTDLKVPMRLAKRFGASNYSTFRRYVLINSQACALIALDPALSGAERIATLRRIVVSKSFSRMIDLGVQVPELLESPHPLAAAIPQGTRRMIDGAVWTCVDRNGDRRHLKVQSFFTGHQILVLLLDMGPLMSMALTPNAADEQFGD
jgi:hypothetical protein